jgi:hypothetical protein
MIRSPLLLQRRMDIPADEVLRWLERILASQYFLRSYRLSLFLRFVVEQSLKGQPDQVKEYTIGTEAYGRTSDFDPSMDSIVRVEARRLRKKLTAYYEGEGASDEIIVAFRPGCYVPSYGRRSGVRSTAGSASLRNSSAGEPEASRVDTCEPKLVVDRGFQTEGGRLYITVMMAAPVSAVSWSQRIESLVS